MDNPNLDLRGERVHLRLLRATDKGQYYAAAFEEPDQEASFFTGSDGQYAREQVEKYIDKIIADEARYDFLIFSQEDDLLGELVIGGIDAVAKSASYRICLFNSRQFNRGFGTEASKLVLKYCFEELGLNRIELEVYAFNHRAQRVYEKLGFVWEGIKREALFF